MTDTNLARPRKGEPRERRLSVRLTGDANKAIDRISELRGGASITEVIRRALGTELVLLEAIHNNQARVLIQDGKGTRELIFR